MKKFKFKQGQVVRFKPAEKIDCCDMCRLCAGLTGKIVELPSYPAIDDYLVSFNTKDSEIFKSRLDGRAGVVNQKQRSTYSRNLELVQQRIVILP